MKDRFAETIREAGPLQESLWYSPTGAFEIVVKKPPQLKPPRKLTPKQKAKARKRQQKDIAWARKQGGKRRSHHVDNETEPQEPITRIEERLKKPRCADFLNGVLAELGKATGRGRDGVTFESLFNLARNSIHYNPKHPSRGSASVDGILIGHPDFKITILMRPEVPSDFTSAHTTIMHEIIHASGKEGGRNYTHFEMADAASIVGGRMGLLSEHDFGRRGDQAIPNPGEDSAKTLLEKQTINNHNSDLFQALLIQACDKR